MNADIRIPTAAKEDIARKVAGRAAQAEFGKSSPELVRKCQDNAVYAVRGMFGDGVPASVAVDSLRRTVAFTADGLAKLGRVCDALDAAGV